MPGEKLPAKANGVALSLSAAEPSGSFGLLFYPSWKRKGWAAARLAGTRTGSPDPLSPPPAGSWGGPGGPTPLTCMENEDLQRGRELLRCPFSWCQSRFLSKELRARRSRFFSAPAFKMVPASRLKFMGTDGEISETLVKSYRVFFTMCCWFPS